MSLRLRLIIAFFTLSVVPLAAVTYYTYTNNVEALRQAAQHEADLLAGELGQRMQLVTAQLSERVEHLADLAEIQAAAGASTTQPATVPAAPTAAVTVSAAQLITDQVTQSLGEAAMLLNNVELFGMGRGAGRRGGSPTAPAGATPAEGGTAAARSSASATRPTPPDVPRRRSGEARPPLRSEAQSGRGAAENIEPPPPPSPGAPSAPTSAEAQLGRLLIDLAPIRREMFREIVPEGTFETMTPEERQKVAREVNQRLLGVVQGIKLGASELQKLAEGAAAQQKVTAAAKPATAAEAPTVPPPPAAPPAPQLTRKSSVAAGRIDVQVQRNGEVVRRVNAEINLPNVLATVFSTTRRDSGEVPFAVAKDGTIHTVSTEDKARVAAFGPVATPGGPSTARVGNWIVVTTDDQSGTGLRLGIARPVGDSMAELRRTTARNAGFGLLFIAVALVGIAPLSSRLTRNLTTLSAAVDRIAKGDYHARVPVKSKDEIGELAAAFNKMAGDVERHQRAAVEQERIRRELELGRRIQAEMLPHAPLKLGLTEVQGVSVPAKEVGGDFFNYFVLPSGQIALLVGDVSGKGVGAALLMANVQASLRTRLALGQDLAAIAREIDQDIEDNSPGPVYATLFVAILDMATRQLRYVNAGHHPQYVLRSQGGLEGLRATGMPVGLFAGHGYVEESVQLSANDLLFFYTDGCVEAENDAGEMFGAERLEALLLSAAGAPDALHRIESGIATFRQRREPFDDATLMTVRVG